MGKGMRAINGVAGLGLVVLGALCTAFYLHSQAPGLIPFMDSGAWLAGALLEMGKIGLMVGGLELARRRQWGRALGILGVCTVLSLISMFTSYQFLAVGATGGKHETVAAQAATQSIERSISGIDAHLDDLDDAIAQNVATAVDYRSITHLKKANEVLAGNAGYLNEKRELVAERNDLLERLSTEQSRATQLDPAEVIAFATIAVLVDLVGMLCVALATSGSAGARPEPIGEEPTPKDEGSVPTSPSMELHKEAEEPVAPIEHSTKTPKAASAPRTPVADTTLAEQALAAIKSGVEPRKAAIREALRVSDKRARLALHELESMGHLVREGRSWSLA